MEPPSPSSTSRGPAYRWAAAAWRWLLGELPERAREERSGALLLWVTAWAGIGMWLGMRFQPKGDPLLIGSWRMLVHGGIPLVGMALWELWEAWRHAWRRGADGPPSRLGTLLALLGCVGLTCVVALRFTEDGYDLQRDAPFTGSAVPGLTSAALVLLGLRLARRDLGAWGIGLGDWRWWLPHHGVLLVGLVPFLVAVTWLVEPLAAFYPTNRAARSDLGAFGVAHLGLGLDFIGWEFLFRGYLLFAAARRGDPLMAVVFSAVPFFLLHGEKPHVELLSSLVGGFFAGWFCLRARSFFPLWIIHLAMITTVGFTSFLMRNGYL